MAYRETWNVCVPVLPGDDEDVLLWLMRESAEKKAERKSLRVSGFEDLGDVPSEDIAPLTIRQLGPAYRGCRFRSFRITAERAVDA